MRSFHTFVFLLLVSIMTKVTSADVRGAEGKGFSMVNIKFINDLLRLPCICVSVADFLTVLFHLVSKLIKLICIVKYYPLLNVL